MRYYLQDVNQILKELNSNTNGISEDKAKELLSKNGKNKFDDEKKKSIFMRFISQIVDPMIIILIIAAFISGIISYIYKEVPTDVIIILFVVVLNAILGVLQESKAEKAIDSLKEMTKSKTKVYRNGHINIINSEDLVVGDVIILEAGDQVPADCRIIESAQLKCDEASLTGESLPVEKIINILTLGTQNDISLADRKNMIFMGSTIVYGRGKALVVETGMNTEMGKIAKVLTSVKEEKTPLQVKLAELSKILTKVVLAICIIIFSFSVIKAGSFDFNNVILPSFMVAISLAVAAIPEGLVTVVTIVLSIGVTKMSKRNAVIRKLTAVETLGCTEVICSDKTGTLTENKMTVVKEWTNDKKLLSKCISFCSDAIIEEGDAKGEPTECALVNYAYNNGIDNNNIKIEEKRVSEIPFDSTRKMMTTIHANNIQYTKGAPDELIKHCTKYLSKDGIVELNEEIKKSIIEQNKIMANDALRVLAGAYKKVDKIPNEASLDMENELIFIGLVGMIDPIRKEVKEAILECKKAGIKVIMITGDHFDTAIAIAKELGIIISKNEALMGIDLDQMSDEYFEQNIEKYSVYARVKPEHKVRIVSTWKKLNKIVAMTGDGVNDAPSIKTADIGIGMGITGTDVTKNVADMVLSDDNFATIVNAIEEGRIIYSNIRKSIKFLLSSNFSEVITIFVATVLGFTILKAPHLLWINLITDCFPALALGVDPPESDIMLLAPRKKDEGIFAGGVLFDMIYQGIMVSILTLIAYYLGTNILYDPLCGTKEMQGMTMAFLTMSMAEIFHSFNMRSFTHSLFSIKKQNKFLWGAMILSIILTALVIEVPIIANAFQFAVIDSVEYFVAILLAFSVIPIVELVKLVKRLSIT
ncbi:MAG: cation-translocating P-type ATPase [Eubacteriales bacterium]|nr:cation-translocating P-type ATPase [Eubacteriales bacterium]